MQTARFRLSDWIFTLKHRANGPFIPSDYIQGTCTGINYRKKNTYDIDFIGYFYFLYRQMDGPDLRAFLAKAIYLIASTASKKGISGIFQPETPYLRVLLAIKKT